jgi:hypothetical protein
MVGTTLFQQFTMMFADAFPQAAQTMHYETKISEFFSN